MALNDIFNLIEKLKRDVSDKESLFHKNRTQYIDIIKNLTSIDKQYPSILNVISREDFDLNGVKRLEYMIRMAKKVEEKEIKEHDASVTVGQVLEILLLNLL